MEPPCPQRTRRGACTPGPAGPPKVPVGDEGIQPFPGVPTLLQLQYSQLSILVFNGVLWPHINVATMRLSAG